MQLKHKEQLSQSRAILGIIILSYPLLLNHPHKKWITFTSCCNITLCQCCFQFTPTWQAPGASSLSTTIILIPVMWGSLGWDWKSLSIMKNWKVGSSIHWSFSFKHPSVRHETPHSLQWHIQRQCCQRLRKEGSYHFSKKSLKVSEWHHHLTRRISYSHIIVMTAIGERNNIVIETDGV